MLRMIRCSCGHTFRTRKKLKDLRCNCSRVIKRPKGDKNEGMANTY